MKHLRGVVAIFNPDRFLSVIIVRLEKQENIGCFSSKCGTRKFVGIDEKTVGPSVFWRARGLRYRRIPLTLLVSANTFENFPTRSPPFARISLFSALFVSR